MPPISQEHSALLCLLRAGLLEKEPDDLSAFPLTEEQWWNVYRMALRQTVSAITFQGLHSLPDTLLPGNDLMMQWVAKTDSIEKKNWNMNDTIGQLFQLMADNDLHPVLLKGQGVAVYYEQPLLRECGDIDLYFHSKKQMKEAAALMSREGCNIVNQPDGSCHYNWHGVDVEHHARLFDIYNPFLKGFLSDLIKEHGFQSCILDEEHRERITVPSEILNLLLLNSHLLKHLMGHGIGLRQFCDMARAYLMLYGGNLAEELEEAYRRTGLLKWSNLLHTFLMEYLGMESRDLPFAGTDTQNSAMLLHIVLEGGNFGQYSQTKGQYTQDSSRRKMNTLLSFWQRRGFSYTYAPKEAFWTAMNLMAGNLKAML